MSLAGDIGTWVGSLATIGLAWAAWYGFRLTRDQLRGTQQQVESLERSLRSSVSEQVMNGSFQVLRFLSDQDPEFYGYFYNDVHPSGDWPPRLKYATEMVANYLEHIALQLPALPDEVRESWRQYIRDNLRFSWVVCVHIQLNGEWYNQELMRMLLQERPGFHVEPETLAIR